MGAERRRLRQGPRWGQSGQRWGVTQTLQAMALGPGREQGG